MSKFLVTAAQVVGAAISIAAAIPTGGTSLLAYGLGVSATTAALIAVASSVAVAGLTALTAKKPSGAASPTEWRANPDQGIDIVVGEAYNAGGIVYRQAYGNKNKYETIVTSWSLGPVDSINITYVDGRSTSTTGDTVNIQDRGKMYQRTQRGLCPEPTNLNCAPIDPFGWTAQHKLSGKGGIINTFVYDAKGKTTFTSIPNCGWRGKGVLCYDPRKDSTYPGGSGPQRWNDQTTWAWSNNAPIVALTFGIGWKQNGKLAGGCGMDISNIIVDQFVEAANVNDVNGWTCGGVKSTADDPHDVMVDILQAGGCELLQLGAKIGCLVNTPRVRLATIDRNCLAQGQIVVPAMASKRNRINGITPTYLFEQQVTTFDSSTGTNVTQTSWAMAPGSPIVVPEYVAADGKERRKPVSYPLVQCFFDDDAKQIGQLARYDIENAREIDGISLPLKLRWYGYKPGDCVGVDLPEASLFDRDVLIRNRGLEAGTGVVTMTMRTETAGKHAYALGQTTSPPSSPSTMPLPDLSAPEPASGDWILNGATISSPNGATAAIAFQLATGVTVDDDVTSIIFEYRPHVAGQADDAGWLGGSIDSYSTTQKFISSVAPGAVYDGSIRYRSGSFTSDRLIIGPATAGQTLTSGDIAQLIVNSKPDSSFAPTAAIDSGGTTATVSIPAHNRIYQDKTVAANAGTIGSLALNTYYALFYDDANRAGGAVTYLASTNPDDALPATTAHPGRHYLGYITTPAAGSTGGSTGGGGGGGGGVGDKPRVASV